MKFTTLTPEALRIFSENHIPAEKNICWEWRGMLYPNKYGHIQYRKNYKVYNFLAHRISYLYYNGIDKISIDTIIRHSCDNPPCCNPSHLFAGTHQENEDDMVAKGRSNTGIKHWNVELTEKKVKEIRYKASFGISQRALSKEYNLSNQHISDIINYKKWKHI